MSNLGNKNIEDKISSLDPDRLVLFNKCYQNAVNDRTFCVLNRVDYNLLPVSLVQQQIAQEVVYGELFGE